MFVELPNGASPIEPSVELLDNATTALFTCSVCGPADIKVQVSYQTIGNRANRDSRPNLM
jgi:hypothetical protein